MADTVKISALTEISSGALDDNSVVPVVDGGVTYKLPISKLKTFVGDSFATDTELSNQISTVNSTISGLDTGDISEGSNLYYTDARVKSKLNTDGVISGSATAIRTFLNVEDGADVTDDNSVVSALVSATGISAGDKTIIQSNLGIDGGVDLGGTGTVSSSAQISDFNTFVENSVTSSMTVLSASYAITASYAENAGGGGGGTDYISNITFSGTTLTFTGTGNAFNSTVDLSTGDLLDLTDSLSYLNASQYYTDSASFESRISAGLGGNLPVGTVSSSIQVLGGSNVISSSTGIANLGAGIISSSDQIDFSVLTADDITEGVVNQYYSTVKVLSYINSLEVVSGSAASGDFNSLTNKPADLVSSSQQVDAFGFFSDTEQLAFSQSIETRFLNIDGIDAGIVNIFAAEQRFEDGIKVTGSVEVQPGLGYFSGSGLGLTNIQAANIVGSIAGDEISSGDLSVNTNASLSLITINAGNTGSVSITAGNGFTVTSGSFFSGSGQGLFNIPSSAIIGGVGSGAGDRIASGSATASITSNGVFDVNTTSNFDGNMVVTGSITATEISVGTTGTPTLFSSTNLNLSASNAVIVTDSPFRLSPQTDGTTGSFSLSNGDIIYSSTSEDFYGYKSGSWVSLTQAGGGTTQGFGGTGIISSSGQIASLGAGIISSSAQITDELGIVSSEVLFEANGNLSGSSDFTYTPATRNLSVNKVTVADFEYSGNFIGVAGSTGSFNRLEGDSIIINNTLEFPTADGLTNQVLKTDGAGNIDFVTVETLITSQDITTTGTITVGTGSVIGTGSISLEDNLTVTGTINGQQISAGNVVLESNNIRLQSGGQLMLSSSNADLGVVIDDVLVLAERDSLPVTPRTGSIIVSGSSSGPRPYFFDGTAWTQMFA